MLSTLRRFDYPEELIELLLKAKVGAFSANLLTPLVMTYLLEDHVPMPILLGWLFIQTTLFTIRMMIANRGQKALGTGNKERVNRLLRLYLLMIFGNALFLGLAGLLAILYAGDVQIFIIAAMIAAVSAGATSTLSPVFHALFIFVVVTSSTFVVSLLLAGTTVDHFFLALMLLFFIIATLPANHRSYLLLIKGIEQRDRLAEKNSNFQNLLDSTMETIIIFDEDQKIVDINRSGLLLFNIEERSEALGRSVLDSVPEHELSRLRQMRDNEERQPFEIDLRKSDGEIFPTLANERDMKLEGKKVTIATILDLTQVKQKDQLLFQQSRQAAMGEMIGNIAHQWRQPLNALGLLMQNIRYSFEAGDLDMEQLERSTEKGQRLMQNMSKTIDDFRDFFRPNRKVEKFSVSEAINSAVELVSASYINNNIALALTLDDGLILEGYPSEFAQVLLNILSNAKDVLQITKTSNAAVSIQSYSKENDTVIEIQDNAGGIDKAIIKKIFDPYFTTKHQDTGTGIGLYMSKMIIEKNMFGKIDVMNSDDGAKFVITVPITRVS